jgi:hypothetical protein
MRGVASGIFYSASLGGGRWRACAFARDHNLAPTISIIVDGSQSCHSSRPPAHALTGTPRLLSRSRGDLRRFIVWSIEVEEVHHGTGVAHHRGMHVRGCGPCGHTHARTHLGQSFISGHMHGSSFGRTFWFALSELLAPCVVSAGFTFPFSIPYACRRVCGYVTEKGWLLGLGDIPSISPNTRA